MSTGQVVAERTLVKLTRCFGSGYPRGVCHATVLRSLAYSLTERPHVEHELLGYPHNYERRIAPPYSGIRCSVSAPVNEQRDEWPGEPYVPIFPIAPLAVVLGQRRISRVTTAGASAIQPLALVAPIIASEFCRNDGEVGWGVR